MIRSEATIYLHLLESICIFAKFVQQNLKRLFDKMKTSGEGINGCDFYFNNCLSKSTGDFPVDDPVARKNNIFLRPESPSVVLVNK